MLRQVFVLKNNEVVYSYLFGTAFSSETLNQVKDTLADFIREPVEGTTFSRPLFNFQAVYASIQKLFFLFVADQSDRPEYVKEVVKPTAAKFLATFPNIPGSLKDTENQNIFEQYLLEVHKNLHPKIALVGPLGVGKTTLAQLIQAQGTTERPIMNFGKIYAVQIGKLTFDLWDWVFPDMFSPLWNNFVRGSDVVIVVIDSTPDGIKGIGQFQTLHQREAKNARIAVVCNKQDIAGALTPDAIKDQVGLATYGITAANPKARFQFAAILEEILDLKKPLPAEFKQLLISANEAIGKENYETAITTFERLIVISKEYQEMGYYQTFQDKLALMKQKFAEKKKRDEIEARKIKAPETHAFTQKVEVKTLAPKPALGFQKVIQTPPPSPAPAQMPSSMSETRTFILGSSPVPAAKPVIIRDTRTQELDTSVPNTASPGPVTEPVVFEGVDTEVAETPPVESKGPDIPAIAQRLMGRIKSLGCAFSLANSRVFVEKMVLKLGREPNDAELEKAAQALVAQVKRVKPSF